jgi:hypothetical protein
MSHGKKDRLQICFFFSQQLNLTSTTVARGSVKAARAKAYTLLKSGDVARWQPGRRRLRGKRTKRKRSYESEAVEFIRNARSG